MKLQFTNGYRPRFDQISRILQILLLKEDQNRITRSEIVLTSGIPNKQIENLTSMMTGFGLILPKITKLTSFGKIVIQFDPYFEKTETLWIIHYLVSSNPKWIVWYRLINEVLPAQDEFSVDQVSERYFLDLASQFSLRTMSEKLPTEVGAVFAAYSRSDLSRLEILKVKENGKFLKTTPFRVPDLAFLYCLLVYRDKHLPGSSAINIEDICFKEFSPGLVFNLPENQVRTILSNLHSMSIIRLEKMANLDQVRLSDSMTQEFVLERIYGGNHDN